MSRHTPFTIGIDARGAVEEPAGRGRVVRELLRALAARSDQLRYRCYARSAWDEPLDERFSWHLIELSDPWWNVAAARRATRDSDVFLSTNSYLTTWFLGIPGVPIVHDLITFEPAMRPRLRSRLIERATLAVAVRRSPAFIAVSQATADALEQRFPRARGRTTVAQLGVATSLASSAAEGDPSELPSTGFVLAVGTLEPRKNLPRLVDAYCRLAPELQQAHQLVVVGAQGWAANETLRRLESLGSAARMLGYVSDSTLAELYRRCAVFCYPSLGEGFGLPVLEAMSAGAAVLTSNVSSLPEVGGDAVEYVDPRDVDGITAALERLLTDENRRRELGRRAAARAEGFSWARFAERVLSALETAGATRV